MHVIFLYLFFIRWANGHHADHSLIRAGYPGTLSAQVFRERCQASGWSARQGAVTVGLPGRPVCYASVVTARSCGLV